MSRRIYIAYVGGTFGMSPTASGYQPQTGLALRLADLLPPPGAGMPEWELNEFEHLIDSANLQPGDWHRIATDIAAVYDAYDAFIIIHGTDTMAYTASALSFMLAGLRKPVILTGAQIPLGEPSSDAVANLTAALMLAAHHPVPEVCIYFQGKLLRGNRATKVSSTALEAFDSPNYPALGSVRFLDTIASLSAGMEITINRDALLPTPQQEAFQVTEPGAHEIAFLRVHPGMSVRRIAQLLDPAPAGLILQSYGSGNAPIGQPGFLETLTAMSAQGTVIVNVSQSLHGGIEQGRYAAGSALASAGVVGLSDMTVEAALVKLHHLFALGLSPDEVRSRMAHPLSGECSVLDQPLVAIGKQNDEYR